MPSSNRNTAKKRKACADDFSASQAQKQVHIVTSDDEASDHTSISRDHSTHHSIAHTDDDTTTQHSDVIELDNSGTDTENKTSDVELHGSYVFILTQDDIDKANRTPEERMELTNICFLWPNTKH